KNRTELDAWPVEAGGSARSQPAARATVCRRRGVGEDDTAAERRPPLRRPVLPAVLNHRLGCSGIGEAQQERADDKQRGEESDVDVRAQRGSTNRLRERAILSIPGRSGQSPKDISACCGAGPHRPWCILSS